MKQYKTIRQLLLLFTSCGILLGCKSTAYSTGTRGPQNFSVRYNYLYNARELMKLAEETETKDHNEDYDQILPVFRPDPLKALLMDKVILKANIIITEKAQSKYVNEAYLLLGKAYFYNRDYFSALGYLDVVITEYQEDQKIYSQALTYKLRSLLELGSNEEAQVLAHNLVARLDKNYKNTEDTYAAIAATYLANNQLKLAIPLLQSAALRTTNKEQQARWTYICAQLQESQEDFTQAATNYSKVKNSNASFELKLSAALKEITLSGRINNSIAYDKSMNRLLRDPDYAESRDQIYYQLGKNAQFNKSYQIALKYFQKSLEEKGKNQVTRGLSYSRIADINLYQLHAYQQAKNYYDSAAVSLPKTLSQVAELDRIDNLRTVSSIYLTVLKEDHPQNNTETPPYNQKVVDGYYEIAIIFLQKTGNPEESQKIFEMLKNRFPDNRYSRYINYALEHTRLPDTENAFLASYSSNQFNKAVEEAADINKNRNDGLIAKKRVIPTEQTAAQVKKAPILQKTDEAPKTAFQLPKPELKVASNEQSNYYFIISINDVSVNLSPTRYNIGEFNRSRFAENNLRHKLLEVEDAQVIYIGIFKTLEEAKDYANEINPQLPNIIKRPKGEYSSTIMSKENLEKLETLEILKQK